jgi:MFS family permease
LQQVLHLSAFKSGLALLPMTVIIMVMMTSVTGKIIAKMGVKATLVLGLLFLTASLVLFSTVSAKGSFFTDVLPASILGAVGMSLAYIPGTITSMSGAKPQETGLASGIVNTSYQVGSALGLAIVVAVSSAATQSTSDMHDGIQVAFIAAAVISVLAVFTSIFRIKK